MFKKIIDKTSSNFVPIQKKRKGPKTVVSVKYPEEFDIKCYSQRYNLHNSNIWNIKNFYYKNKETHGLDDTYYRIYYNIPDDFDIDSFLQRFQLMDIFKTKTSKDVYKFYNQHKDKYIFDSEYYVLQCNIPEDFDLDIFKDVYPDLANKTEIEIFKILKDCKFLLNDVYYRVYYDVPKYFDIITFKQHFKDNFKHIHLDEMNNKEIYKYYNKHKDTIYFNRYYFGKLQSNNIISYSISDLNSIRSRSAIESNLYKINEETNTVVEEPSRKEPIQENSIQKDTKILELDSLNITENITSENIEYLENLVIKNNKYTEKTNYKFIYLHEFNYKNYYKILLELYKNKYSTFYVFVNESILQDDFFLVKTRKIPKSILIHKLVITNNSKKNKCISMIEKKYQNIINNQDIHVLE